MNTPDKTRSHIRFTEEQRRLIDDACALTSTTLNAFVVNAAIRVALDTVEKHRMISLSQRDAKTFMDALSAPATPNEKLLKAVKLHDEVLSR